MSAFASVIVLSFCMFFASMLFGISPTVITISERRTHVLGAFGAGLLVGTALGVIMPEGISEVYSVHEHHGTFEKHVHGHEKRDLSIRGPTVDVDKRHLNHQLNLNEMLDQDQHDCMESLHAIVEGKNKLIGTALVAGFIFMLLVDFLMGGSHHHHNSQHGSIESVSASRSHQGWIATLGLIVHSATDGIAMGAASFADSSVTAIVFFAILLHKGPAAFGLAVYLLHNGLDVSKVRKQLFFFSCSAPLATILTYVIVSQTAAGGSSESPTNTIGVLLLLSAGSFIYVATVHILPSVTLHQASANTSFLKKCMSLELLCLLLGSSLPLLLHVDHHH